MTCAVVETDLGVSVPSPAFSLPPEHDNQNGDQQCPGA
jgi:hypothetical protein